MSDRDPIEAFIERIRISSEHCELCWHLHSMIQLLMTILEENETTKKGEEYHEDENVE